MKFTATNNEAEYEAVIVGLSIAREVGARNVEVQSDSQVVVGHIKREYEAKGEKKMKKYLTKVKSTMRYFDKVLFTKVPWEHNTWADTLARIGSSIDMEISVAKCLVQEQPEPSIIPTIQVAQVNKDLEGSEWARDIIHFLKNGELPDNKKYARKIRVEAVRHTLVGNTLYRRGYTLPLLKCLSELEAKYIINEIHEGLYGSHIG